MARSRIALIAALSVWGGILNTPLVATGARATTQRPRTVSGPTVIETADAGRIRVEQSTINGRPHETLVITLGRSVYRVPDERVYDLGQSGEPLYFNEDETRYDHDFFLSPQGGWLFVTRKLYHRVNVGYLYRLSGKHSDRVRPRGRRFDEAAIEFFTRRLHLPYPAIDGGARVIHFQRWTSRRLVFSLDMNRSYDGKGPEYSVVGFYGLRSRRFGLISLSVP